MSQTTASKLDSLTNIRLILFDLDGTIRRMRPTAHEALVAYAAEAGAAFDDASRRAGMRWEQRCWADSATGSMEPADAFGDDFVRQYFLAMGAAKSDAESLAARIAQRLREEYKPEAYLAGGAKELLWLLRTRGYKLGLVANWPIPLTGVAIELSVIEHFNFTVSTGQMPDRNALPAFFRHACALGEVAEPREALAVGTNYYATFLAAREAGMRTALLDEYELFPEAAEEGIVVRELAALGKLLLPEDGETQSK